MSDSAPYVPFSQRTGLAPIPPQLKLGQVSLELRRLIDYAIRLEIRRETDLRLSDKLRRVAMDLHVRLFRQPAYKFDPDPNDVTDVLSSFVVSAKIGELFDFVEFLVRHPGCSGELKRELSNAFVEARTAYRVFDNQYIAAIGTEEQAAAYERAVADADIQDAPGARRQLIAAGVALRNGDWAGSVRDSIHAVESVALRLAPSETTLGAALKVIERQGYLHGALKAAFEKLYGYSSDEKGVRHALVFDDEAKVDEADAMFMLGACASFVSYLLARAATGPGGLIKKEEPPAASPSG